MLNWRFVQAQFKRTWVIIFFFGLSFLFLAGLTNIWTSFAFGGADYLNTTLFGMSSLSMFMSFGAVMGIVMINTDINTGHIGSWLTTPMSRIKVFNSKLFVLIISVFLFNSAIIILEMISFSIRMSDFKATAGHLLIGNFTLLVYSLMVTSGTWLICCLFQKNKLALGIIIALFGWFMLCSIMTNIGQASTSSSSLKKLEYFKFFTVQSLFNSPLQYSKPTGDDMIFFYLLPLKALNYAWQIPLMLGVAASLYIGGQFIVKKKDFAF